MTDHKLTTAAVTFSTALVLGTADEVSVVLPKAFHGLTIFSSNWILSSLANGFKWAAATISLDGRMRNILCVGICYYLIIN